MFENVLDCPKCQHRFNYEHAGEEYPEFIICPQCGENSPSGAYYILLLCHECHSKLKLPLAKLNSKGNICPRCSTEIQADILNTAATGPTTLPGITPDCGPKRMLQDGDFFDKFRIVSLLGKGGMAEVYLAEHLLLKQLCALKLMQKYLDQDENPIYIKRFVREAKLTHSLNHPNIVRVFDAGSDFKTGYLFLAMEYVEGTTLHNLIYQKVLAESELLEILTVMAEALKKLEEAKIVHRDIKPSNIMYTNEGVYKLMDLGIAKMESNHQAGDMTLTMEQSSIGTPGYASPEQCRTAHNVDIRSDIFSLGATLYHAATRNMPFKGSTPVETILNTAQKNPTPIRNFRSDLSDDFILLIEKMLKKQPSERYQSVDELLEAIEKAKQGKNYFLPVRKLGTAVAALSALTTTFFTRKDSEEQEKKPEKKKRKKITLATFSPLFKYLKFLLALMILSAIGGSGYFIYLTLNSTGTDRKNNYRKFVKNVLDKVESTKKIIAPTPAASGKDKAEMHPLIPDPDKDLRRQVILQQGEKVISYPIVMPTIPTKGQPEISCSFETMPPFLRNASPAMLRNGILELPPAHKVELSLAEVPLQKEEQLTAIMNLKLSAADTIGLFTFCGLDLFIQKGILCLVYNKQYHASTNVTLPVDSWFNLAVSLDHSEGRINILSEDRLLCSYFYPRQTRSQITAFKFKSDHLNKEMTGMIDHLAIYSAPPGLRPSLPFRRERLLSSERTRLPDSIVHALAASWFPYRKNAKKADQKVLDSKLFALPFRPREGRLKTPLEQIIRVRMPVFSFWNRQNALDGESMEETFNRSQTDFWQYDAAVTQWKNSSRFRDTVPYEIIEARKILIRAAEEFRRFWSVRVRFMNWRNRLIREGQRKNYNSTATQQLGRLAGQYLEKNHSAGFSSADADLSRRLKALLSSPTVDPDLRINDSAPLVNAVISGRFWQSEELLKTLMARHVSIEHLESLSCSNKIRNILIEYGLPGRLQNRIFNSLFEQKRFSGDCIQLMAALTADGVSPTAEHLTRAVKLGDYPVTLFLLACGINPNDHNAQSKSALMCLPKEMYNTPLHHLLLAAGAAAPGSSPVTALQTEERSQTSETKAPRSAAPAPASPAVSAAPGPAPRQQVTPANYSKADFMTLWNSKNKEGLAALLKGKKISADLKLPGGRTLLTEACTQGNEDLVKLLLDNGADPDREDQADISPLQACGTPFLETNLNYQEEQGRYAEAQKRSKILFMLLEKGAGVKTLYKIGGRSRSYLLPLFIRSFPNRNELIPGMIKYLKRGRAPVNIWFLLITASSIRKEAFGGVTQANKLRLLRECPVDCLKILRLYHRVRITPEIMRRALDGGLRPNSSIVVTSRTARGEKRKSRRPLLYFLAIGGQSLDVIRMAVESGADPRWQNENGSHISEFARDHAARNYLMQFRQDPFRRRMRR